VDNLVEWSKDNRRTTLAPHGEIRAHTFALDEAVSGRYDSFLGRGTITGQLTWWRQWANDLFDTLW